MIRRRPLTAAAWLRARSIPCGFCGGQSDNGTCFSPITAVNTSVSFRECSILLFIFKDFLNRRNRLNLGIFVQKKLFRKLGNVKKTVLSLFLRNASNKSWTPRRTDWLTDCASAAKWLVTRLLLRRVTHISYTNERYSSTFVNLSQNGLSKLSKLNYNHDDKQNCNN